MKIKKLLALTLSAVMLVSLLTGCTGTIIGIKLNEDGSGVATTKVGMTKEVMMMFEDMQSEGELADYDKFEYNGVTYYGETETIEFKSIEELNTDINSDESSDSADIDTGKIEFGKDSNGNFTFKLVASESTGDTTEYENEITTETADMDISDEELEMLMSSMAMVIEIEFPKDVHQVSGGVGGVTITGNKLTLDIIKLGLDMNENGLTADEYYFVASGDGPIILDEPVIKFDDVAADMWCADAVYAMAKSGYVLGIGDGKFNPNGTLTYGQFCQILARVLNFETGEAHGSWAGKACENIVKAGFVNMELTPEVMNKAITREVAVAAMQRALIHVKGDIPMTMNYIIVPDEADIAEDLRGDIQAAYHTGVTNGVDADGTFLPKGNLTRGQVCQLFYNLGWHNGIK